MSAVEETPTTPAPSKPPEPSETPRRQDTRRNEIDEASWASFPASDPPSYNPGTATPVPRPDDTTNAATARAR